MLTDILLSSWLVRAHTDEGSDRYARLCDPRSSTIDDRTQITASKSSAATCFPSHLLELTPCFILIALPSFAQHFDLVSQRDIEKAREHVATEVRPHVEELCRRATAEIARQDRRAAALKNRNESLQQRIQNMRLIDLHQAKLNHTASAGEEKQHEETEEQLQIKRDIDEHTAKLEKLRRRKEALLATADKLESETQGQI